jgi:pectinesterase
MLNIKRISALLLLTSTLFVGTYAQKMDHSWEQIALNKDTAWFSTPEAKQIAENVLLYQRDNGGWPKNTAMYKPLSDKEKKDLKELKKKPEGTSSDHGTTIDNGATFLEMTFLSKMYARTPDERYKAAFLAGLDYILKSQYENGGWPQFYPIPKGYYSHITFNDDAMVNVLSILREIGDDTGYFSIKPTKETVEKAKKSFDKGVECILNTQYKQNGVLTAWCAQHDEITMLPAKARAYELPSLSGKESAQIVLLLMALPNPSQRVIDAVDGAVKWFEKTQITGFKEVKIYDKGKIIEKKLEKDEQAPPMWARFMELENNKPFFCDRDGIKKSSYSEIGIERRTGYAWYTDEPANVLKKYPKWKAKYSATNPIKNDEHKPKDPFYIVVSQDGSGDYTTIQQAVDNAKAFPYERITIFVKDGFYKEKVKIHEWNTNISLIGESKEKTIISYDDYFGKINMGPNSTFYTPTLFVEGDNFIAKNLTIENTSGEVGQAIALSVFADKVLIENCNLLGNQDTLYASGDSAKQYYKNCYIEGTTDFIFGRATAFFESCIIYSKKSSYITAASTPQGVEYGFVFNNCKLTANDSVTNVSLGRPWRIYAKTVFINCELGGHIKPEGWNNWSKPDAEKTTFYAEYNSFGKGSKIDKRVVWSHQLSKAEAEKYTPENILGKPNWYNEIKK